MPPRRQPPAAASTASPEPEPPSVKKASTIVCALATAVENAARALSLDEVQQSLIYAEILRCVAAESKITVLTSWFLNYYFAWLSDDQISEGHADVNHALIAAAAAIVNNLGGQAGREQPLMRECFQAFEPIVPREFWPRHEKGGGTTQPSDAHSGQTTRSTKPSHWTRTPSPTFASSDESVVIVDEYRTSKVCHHCQHENTQNRFDWGSKHCKSVCHWTFNRDVNAARNISMIFTWKMQGYERPQALRVQPRL